MLPRALVVAPHPDDDVLACGGIIALGHGKEIDFHVVYMTDGRNSHAHVVDIWLNPSPLEVREVRRAEAIAGAKMLGVPPQNLTFLDFEDGTLANHVEDATSRLRDLVERLKPAWIYYPLGVDAHRDHKATAAIVDATRHQTKSESVLLGYIVWPSEEEPPPDAYVRVEVDVEKVLPKKREAIKRHRSQVSNRFSKQTRPILSEDFLARFLRNREIFYHKLEEHLAPDDFASNP